MRYHAILGTLVARTAVHIGTGEGGDTTDDLCRRDAEGNFIIPGTALGGVLRTIATRLAPRLGSPVCRALWSQEEQNRLSDEERHRPCACWVCHLFGDINPGEGDTEEEGGRASRLFVAHAKASLPDGKTLRIRDGVGIDRMTRVAARAAAVKFDMEVLPKGTEFDLRLELEDADENDERLLAVALAEWQAGRAWIGGRMARGLGAFDLTGVKLVERDLSNEDGLMGFLKADTPWVGASERAGWLDGRLNEARKQVQGSTACHDGVARSFVTVRFDLKIQGPFLTNDTAAAVHSGFDSVPLLDMINTNGKPVLPGSSLRGALRSHAERIARTLATLETTKPDDFLVKCPACNPVESGDENAALVNCDTLLRKVAKIPDEDEVTDDQLCLACRLFGSTRRGSRLFIEDAEADVSTLRKVLDFLAVDRFTSGGREGAKFDAFALWQPGFSVRLHLENPASWELGWLMLVLRDIQDEMLTVGFGGAKGFGRASVGSLTMHYGFISDDDFAGPTELTSACTSPSSGLYRVITWDTRDKAQREHLVTLAQAWVTEFNKMCKAFEREQDLHLKKDSYFDGNIPKLYEKEAYRCLL